MENAEDFKALNENKGIIYPEKIREELVTTAKELIKDYPNIGALVLEYANMPAYSKFIQEALKLPVFNFLTLTNWVYSAIVKQ